MEERQKRLALVGVMLAIFLAALESTVVALAMPTVVAKLGGLEIYSWVFSGYMLTQTITMPLWGRCSDLYGRRPVYLIGLTTFLLGSVLSGAAQDMVQLIVFRMLQGVGAGSLMTLGYTVVGEIFGLERRARLQGYLAGVWGVASMLGPPLGGVLTDHVSWRSVFYLNVPPGLLAMALLATALAGVPRSERRPGLDYAGVSLFTAGVSALLLGTVQAGRAGGWSGLDVIGLLIAGGVALAAFVAVERRAVAPIVPLGLFRNRVMVAAVVTRALAAMAMFGALTYVPLFLQAVTGMTALQAGGVLAPFVLGWVALSAMSARLVLRVGYRGPVMAGMVCLTTAFFLFTRWSDPVSQLGAMRDTLLAGMGMGLVVVPMLIAVQSTVPRADLGIATSVIQFFMSIGGAVGISVMGTVMAQRLHAGSPLVEALHGVFVVGLTVSVVALASAFLVPRGSARELARAEVRGEPTHAGG